MVAAIDGAGLLEVVWVSLLAGIAVTVLFAFVVVFGARSAEAGRGGRAGRSMGYAVAAVLVFGLFAFVVGYGVHVMLSKG